MEKDLQIKVTKDYDQFKFLEENRTVSDSHVKAMMDSLLRYDDLHLNPIIVNEKMEIVDGQNRFLAAREIEKPIYYQVDHNFSHDKIVSLNTVQKNWTAIDFLKYWQIHGTQDYVDLRRVIEKYGLSVHVAFDWFSSGKGKTAEFKKGKFLFNYSEVLMERFLVAMELLSIVSKNKTEEEKLKRRKAFHRACKKFFLNKHVKVEDFFHKLQCYPKVFNLTNSFEGFLQSFVDIYNWKRRNGDPSCLNLNFKKSFISISCDLDVDYLKSETYEIVCD